MYLEKRRHILKQQFRDMLESWAASFSTGSTMQMAFEREKYVVVKRVWILELSLNSKIAVSPLPNHLSQDG